MAQRQIIIVIQRQILKPFLLGFLVLSAFLSTLFLSGCHTQMETEVSGPIRVKVPWMTERGEEYRIIEVTTLKNIETLQGEALEILQSSHIWKKKGEILGSEPHIRVIKTSDGYYIGKDPISQQLLTLYVHFEKLMYMDRSLGYGSLQSWPRKAVISTKAQIQNSILNHDNAFYSPKYDAYVFPPYGLELAPLSINPGVVAHEHFHAHFQKLVKKPLIEKKWYPKDDSKKTQYIDVLLDALNEGLADYWGWTYSNLPDFFYKSMPQMESSSPTSETQSSSLNFSRSLSQDFGDQFPDGAFLRNKLSNIQPITSKEESDPVESLHALSLEESCFVYRIGTYYALAFKKLTDVNKVETSKTMAKKILTALETLPTVLMKQELEQLEPNFFIKHFQSVTKKEDLNDEQTQYLNKLLTFATFSKITSGISFSSTVNPTASPTFSPTVSPILTSNANSNPNVEMDKCSRRTGAIKSQPEESPK